MENLHADSPDLALEGTADGYEPFTWLLRSKADVATFLPPSVVVGSLLALADGRSTPYVGFDGQLTAAAVPARSVVDLFPTHIGRKVLLAFDAQDLSRPIVLGVLRGAVAAPTANPAMPVELLADGQRLTVSAQAELVLRCGRSCIILTSDGRIELRADVIVSQAAEVNRIRGGSVQLN